MTSVQTFGEVRRRIFAVPGSGVSRRIRPGSSSIAGSSSLPIHITVSSGLDDAQGNKKHEQLLFFYFRYKDEVENPCCLAFSRIVLGDKRAES